jgi:hypothetical protein
VPVPNFGRPQQTRLPHSNLLVPRRARFQSHQTRYRQQRYGWAERTAVFGATPRRTTDPAGVHSVPHQDRRLWRARNVLEKALAQTEERLGAGARQQVEAALNDLLEQPNRAAPATEIKAGAPSENRFYILRYLAPIDATYSYALDRDAEDEQPGGRSDTAASRATYSLISEFREIGQDFQKNGLVALAEEVHRHCLALANAINSNILKVQSLTDLAIVSSVQSDYRAAEEFAQRAVAACPNSREAMQTIVTTNLGLILLENERGAEGRELLESAGPFWRERIRIDALFRESPEAHASFVVVTKDDPTAWRSQDHLAAAYAGLGLFHLYRGELALAEKHQLEAHPVVGLYSQGDQIPTKTILPF